MVIAVIIIKENCLTSNNFARLLLNIGAKPEKQTLTQADKIQSFLWQSNQKGIIGQFMDDGNYCKRHIEGTEVVVECYFPCGLT